MLSKFRYLVNHLALASKSSLFKHFYISICPLPHTTKARHQKTPQQAILKLDDKKEAPQTPV